MAARIIALFIIGLALSSCQYCPIVVAEKPAVGLTLTTIWNY